MLRLPLLIRRLALGKLEEALIIRQGFFSGAEVIVRSGQEEKHGRGCVRRMCQLLEKRNGLRVPLLEIDGGGQPGRCLAVVGVHFQGGAELPFGLRKFLFLHKDLRKSAMEIREPRLYQLIRQKGPVKDRTFEIEFLDPGVQAFSFTFG